MKARILKSPYPEVTPGTVGEVQGTCDGGLAILVDGHFTTPGATPAVNPGQRVCYFEREQVEILTENGGTCQELIFIQAFDWLAAESHRNAVEKGFWQTPRNDGELIALMHSELSECLEGLRHGNPASEHIPAFSAGEEELADVLIRLADMAGAKGWKVGLAVIAKMKFNAGREKMHGKQF